MKQKLSLLLLSALFAQLLLFSSISVLPTVQGTIPKPSVPEFTIRLVDASTSGSTVYTTNPYTGANEPIYRQPVYDSKIHLTVKNQPYLQIIDGIESVFKFDVRVKGHFGEDWAFANVESTSPETAPLDGSGYTEIILPAGHYAAGAQVDVKVEAVLNGEVSGWSAIQTVTIPAITRPTESTTVQPSETPINNPASSTQTATEKPESGSDEHWNQTSLVFAVIAIIVVVDVLALTAISIKRHKKGHRIKV